jgi:hypothetical protein
VVQQVVPKEAEITNVTFDPSLGEVVIEAKKPGLANWKKRIYFAGDHETDALETASSQEPSNTVQDYGSCPTFHSL